MSDTVETFVDLGVKQARGLAKLVVHRRTLLRQKAQPVALHSDPTASSAVTARMAGRTVAQLVRCEGGWCKVRASGRSGWAPAREFWGTSDRVQCR